MAKEMKDGELEVGEKRSFEDERRWNIDQPLTNTIEILYVM